jgi:hypothetical protein
MDDLRSLHSTTKTNESTGQNGGIFYHANKNRIWSDEVSYTGRGNVEAEGFKTRQGVKIEKMNETDKHS